MLTLHMPVLTNANLGYSFRRSMDVPEKNPRRASPGKAAREPQSANSPSCSIGGIVCYSIEHN
eukprot:IDg11240t1